MTSKLANSAISGLGVGVGVAIYDLITDGVGGVDWMRALFVGAFVFLAWLLFLTLFGSDDERDVTDGNS